MSQKTPPPPLMPTNSPLFRVMNSLMGLMLRSPFHGGMSKQLGLITVTGRKSGKKYTTPVGYLRIDDTHVHVFTHAAQWWKNLRGGGPVTIRMQGKDYHGTGTAVEDRAVITDALYNYISKVPGSARPFGTHIVDGKPVREDVVAHAPLTIMVDIILDK
jgi:deazaflavin-dependent oxidoreductase (nitroreductase family)